MSVRDPAWLLALLLIPALIAAMAAARRRRHRYAIRFTALPALTAAAGPANRWRRHIPAALLLAAIATLALALARPRQRYQAAVGQAQVMLVSDHSGSMAATDVAPTRLNAAISAADTFIAKLPSSVKVGAIAFGSSPDASQAPASDKSAAKAVIDGQMANGSTATGDALALALQLLHGADRRHLPSAIVLLSDGSANAGTDSVAVARLARTERIPIDTVALGTPNGSLQDPTDPLAAPIPVPPDPALMAQIAAASGGRTFTVQSSDVLSAVYGSLATKLGTVTRTREITVWFAIAGLALLLGATAVSVRRSGRLP